MKDEIRQWLVDNPRAMDVAYAATLGSAIVIKIGTNDAAGATSGP